ncbi:MAG: M24 family metallopeptidase [bacterium]|nr:M24 family metallopeptidase [bacterium]
MNAKLRKLQEQIRTPLLISKKENLLYLTGRSFINGWLLVMPAHNSSQPPLKIRGGADRAGSPLKIRGGRGVIFLGDGLEKVEKIHTDKFENVRMYLGGYRTLQLEDSFSFAEANVLKARLGSVKLEPVKSPVEKLREIKDAREIGYMRASGKIVEKVWKQVKKDLLKKTWTEAGLAARIVDLGRGFGSAGVSFDPIVAAGTNAATPHHIPGVKKLPAGEPIIIDFGFKYRGYCSDFTRTVFLKRAPGKWVEIYNQVEKAYLESIRFVSRRDKEDRPLGQPQRTVLKRGRVIRAGDVYQKAVEILAEKNLDKYFIHNLGHGCGLEIHESPSLSAVSKDVLRAGMVFSIEPGVYLPKAGGIRIEDLVCLRKSGATRFVNAPTDLKSNLIKS